MTREEAIKLLVNATYSDEWQGNEDLTTAHNMAIKALEQTELADGDRAISLNAVMTILASRGIDETYIGEQIRQLPSVKPQEPKTGHWISHYDEDAKEGWYECDRCHTERAFNTDFCPDCGARMVEPQEVRDEE